jgi:hypothetical protein
MHNHEEVLFSLDQELEKELETLDKVVEEQAPAPAPSIEDSMRDEILRHLQQHPKAPSESDIKGWKAKYGESGIQVSAFDSENVFVYTHLTLAQWEKIDALRKKMATTSGAEQDATEKRVREAVLKGCVLWPKLDEQFFQTCRAGLPTTLFDLVMINSYFLTPQQALTLTTKL